LSAAIGYHPDYAEDISQQVDSELVIDGRIWEKVIDSLEAVASKYEWDACGEIGLDYFRLQSHNHQDDGRRLTQKRLFQEQLIWAASRHKPIILHVRDQAQRYLDETGAYLETLQLVEEYAPEETIIFHCFSGAPEYLARILRLPRSRVSFAGNVTFKSAQNLRELARMVPADRLLIETDAPFLSPEPKRGQPCLPEFIVHTAELLQEQLGVDLEQVYRNSLAIFRPDEL